MRTHCCGHLVAHDVSWAAQTGNHLLWTQNVSATKSESFFVSATNVARAGKRGNICVGNNMSSFARAFTLSNDGMHVRTISRSSDNTHLPNHVLPSHALNLRFTYMNGARRGGHEL